MRFFSLAGFLVVRKLTVDPTGALFAARRFVGARVTNFADQVRTAKRKPYPRHFALLHLQVRRFHETIPQSGAIPRMLHAQRFGDRAVVLVTVLVIASLCDREHGDRDGEKADPRDDAGPTR